MKAIWLLSLRLIGERLKGIGEILVTQTNVFRHRVKSIYSEMMEASEKHNKAIKLGRLIIAQIEEAPQQDVQSGWIACYISELLQRAESAEGKEREELQSVCFSTILELWEHLHYLPSGYRPTRDFEAVINTLDAITPESRRHFFGLDPVRKLKESNDKSEIRNELDLILSVDALARNIIGYLLSEVCKKLSDEDHRDLAQIAEELYPDPYTKLLNRIYLQMEESAEIQSNLEAPLSDTGKLIELATAYRSILEERSRSQD